MGSDWPALPMQPWRDTRDTLHLLTQVVGKTKLALAPPEPEFGHVTLWTTASGLTTGPMPAGAMTLQVDFDFIAHKLVAQTSAGGSFAMTLGPRTVASFYEEYFRRLGELEITISISPIPQEVTDLTPLDQDRTHASYDAEHVRLFWHVLSRVDAVIKRYRAPFRGRHTPVQFFWGTFDLCYDRFSGKPAAPPPGANYLYRNSMDAEQIYVGFWPGDARFPEPAFASYTYPKPAGIEQAQIGPKGAAWNAQLGEFTMRYDDARAAASPEDAIMEFCTSTYGVSADLAKWDRARLG